MLGIPDSVMPHVRRFGFSGVVAVGIVVVMLFGINPVTVLTGQVAEPLPHTTLTALAAINAGEGKPEDLVGAVQREANGFWERAFRSAAIYYPPASLVMVASNRELGCGMAGSDLGTFYCPENSTIYVDMDAYSNLVENYPTEGDVAEGYLIGVAYGQHVQKALGELDKLAALDTAQRVEREQQLAAQAACYGGVWTKWAGLEMLFDNPAITEAIDSINPTGDVSPGLSHGGIPRLFAPVSAAYRKFGFDLGYAIPAGGSCSLAKIGAPI